MLNFAVPPVGTNACNLKNDNKGRIKKLVLFRDILAEQMSFWYREFEDVHINQSTCLPFWI